MKLKKKIIQNDQEEDEVKLENVNNFNEYSSNNWVPHSSNVTETMQPQILPNNTVLPTNPNRTGGGGFFSPMSFIYGMPMQMMAQSLGFLQGNQHQQPLSHSQIPMMVPTNNNNYHHLPPNNNNMYHTTTPIQAPTPIRPNVKEMSPPSSNGTSNGNTTTDLYDDVDLFETLFWDTVGEDVTNQQHAQQVDNNNHTQPAIHCDENMSCITAVTSKTSSNETYPW